MKAKERQDVPHIYILGARVDAVQIPDITRYMENRIAEKGGCSYIVVANADTIVKSRYDAAIRESVNASSLSIPDGFPLMLIQRFHGHPLKKRAYGPELMFEFLKISENNGYTHYFYGAADGTLARLIKNMKALFPRLKIAGFYAPPFRAHTQKEDMEIIKTINVMAPDVLWVGIGCPKQELWMHDHKEKLNVPIMVGVGAAFDFLAGTKPQAPAWMRNNGFEWLFRLMTEPKRLWRRYLVNNTLFIYHVGMELLSRFFNLQQTKSKQ